MVFFMFFVMEVKLNFKGNHKMSESVITPEQFGLLCKMAAEPGIYGDVGSQESAAIQAALDRISWLAAAIRVAVDARDAEWRDAWHDVIENADPSLNCPMAPKYVRPCVQRFVDSAFEEAAKVAEEMFAGSTHALAAMNAGDAVAAAIRRQAKES